MDDSEIIFLSIAAGIGLIMALQIWFRYFGISKESFPEGLRKLRPENINIEYTDPNHDEMRERDLTEFITEHMVAEYSGIAGKFNTPLIEGSGVNEPPRGVFTLGLATEESLIINMMNEMENHTADLATTNDSKVENTNPTAPIQSGTLPRKLDI